LLTLNDVGRLLQKEALVPAGNALFGTIDPDRSIKNQRAYLTAFFDTHLRDRDSHLLDRPSPRFPEMQFIP